MNSSPRVLAVVPARAGSKRFPGKNTRPFLDIPLIGHSILFAQLCPEIDRCIVSTDSPGIAEVAKAFGGDVPFMRPSELAQDETPMWPVLRHALSMAEEIEQSSYDYLILLDPTSPAREPSDVSEVVRLSEGHLDAEGVIGVSQPDFNPIWHCVVERNGWMRDLFDDGGHYDRRQDVGAVYRINGSIYLWRASFVRQETVSWRRNGKHIIYEVPDIRAVSIDTPEELERAELLVKNGLVEFPWLRGREAKECAR